MQTEFFRHFELSFGHKTEFFGNFLELSFPKIGTEFFNFVQKISLQCDGVIFVIRIRSTHDVLFKTRKHVENFTCIR